MKITFKSLVSAVLTFGLPGIGQAFYGEWGWAVFWLFAAIVTGGLTMWPTAIHCFILADKKR